VATAIPTNEVAVVDPGFSDPERYALAAFLAGYRGLARDAYALDLRQFIAWCHDHDRRMFDVRRADIECFARDLEACGRTRATVARRLCTVSGFYRYAEQEAASHADPRTTMRYDRARVSLDRHATYIVAAFLTGAAR